MWQFSQLHPKLGLSKDSVIIEKTDFHMMFTGVFVVVAFLVCCCCSWMSFVVSTRGSIISNKIFCFLAVEKKHTFFKLRAYGWRRRKQQLLHPQRLFFCSLKYELGWKSKLTELPVRIFQKFVVLTDHAEVDFFFLLSTTTATPHFGFAFCRQKSERQLRVSYNL